MIHITSLIPYSPLVPSDLLEARGVPPHVLTSFGSRMHLFLNRSSSTMSHAQQLLGKLQSKQEAQQLDACVELCQVTILVFT